MLIRHGKIRGYLRGTTATLAKDLKKARYARSIIHAQNPKYKDDEQKAAADGVTTTTFSKMLDGHMNADCLGPNASTDTKIKVYQALNVGRHQFEKMAKTMELGIKRDRKGNPQL